MPKVWNKRRGSPRDAIYVGRGSEWGNPYEIGVHGTRAECIKLFCEEVLPGLDLEHLRGRDLLCWCWPKPCHADDILKEIERRYPHDTGT